MKYLSFFTVALLLDIVSIFPFPGSRCLSQDITWQRTNGPYGGRIFQVTCAPNGVLLAAIENCGIFRSTDDGETWQQTSLNTETLVAFAVDSQGCLFAGAYNASGVFMSSDAGLTWSQTNAGLDYNGVLSLAISPMNHIFAGTFYNGVFRSTDGGVNWTKLQMPIYGDAVYPVWSICVDSSGNVFAGVSEKGLFRSSNDGETWTQVGFQGADIHSLICPSPTEILAGTGNGIYQSTDIGETWIQLGGNFPSINSIGLNQVGHIFAFTDDGLFRSIDRGLSWISLNVGFRATRFLSGSISSKGYVYAGSDGDGIARSMDNGATWKEVNTGLTGNGVWAIASTTGGFTLAGTDRGLYLSANKGETWTLSNALPAPVQSLVAVASRLVFAATSAGVYRSTDAGMNWQRVDKGFAWNYIYSVCADSSNAVFAGTSLGQIYRSTDSGETWTQAIETGSSIYALASSGRGEVFAGTNVRGIYRSTDRGITWTQANNGIPDGFSDRTIFSIAVLRIGDIWASSASGKLLRSTDNGNSWNTIIDTASNVWSIVEDGNETIYAGTRNGVYSSSNHGFSWFVAGNGLGENSVRVLSFDNDGYLFAGLHYGGVFRTTQNVWVEFPSSFRLSQNYPNPFNSSTIIGFSLPQAETVKLRVYNLIGQEIATLVSDYLSAGKHEVRWNALVPSGIYFYHLQAGSFVETKKMVLLR